MGDDLNRRAPEDPTKINVDQPWELRYWTDELGVSEQTLIAAVKAVGPMVEDVKRHLGV